MFINLSNHPSAEWSEEQLRAARQYGEIVDLPFPAVSPDATPDTIRNLADAVVDQIRSFDTPLVVHVMGEMTFTCTVVARLKTLGIICLASTTERHADMAPDGKKISEFKFVQFREY